MFKCKVCIEKDKRIEDLKGQISYLKQVLSIPNDPEQTPAIHLEADGVLSGQQHVIDITDISTVSQDTIQRQADEERSERDRLLSGTY